MSKTLTVLMAVYNGGEYLKQSVKSVLDQTYRDFEFLIVDDCSTDNTVETIKAFNDGRIKIHCNEKNLGQTESLNVGLRIASGEYIARIDADDIVLPHWLETQLAGILKVPQMSVVSSYAFVIDEENKIKKLYKHSFDRERIILRSMISSPISHVSSIYRKEDIITVGGYDTRYITAADYGLWSKLLRDGFRITVTPKMLVAIREHSQSLSRLSRGGKEMKEIMDISAENIKAFSKEEFSDEAIRLFIHANYDEGGLSADELKKAVEVVKKVYGNLDASLNINDRKASRWTRKLCRTLYIKSVFAAINRREFTVARDLCRQGIREFGVFSLFTALFVMSGLSKPLLSCVPSLYGKMLRQKTRFHLGFRLNAGMFH